MLNFQDYYSSRTRLSVLNEGGQAAENLIPDLEDQTGKDLKYARSKVDDKTLKEVDAIYNLLVSNNFIKDSAPSYVLGSTRLFAIKAGLITPQYDEIETQEIVQRALETKTSFGDIDLDVVYSDGVTSKDIKTFIENHNPDKYRAQLLGSEVSIAVVVDGTNTVIQIDIVDLQHNEPFLKLTQFSSMADLAQGIKGALRDILSRAIARTHPIPKNQHQAVLDLVQSTDAYKEFFRKWADKSPEINLQYSFSAEGLLLKVTWYADGKKKSYSKKGVKFSKLKDFIQGNQPGVQPVSYTDDEIIANIFGIDSANRLNHAVTMLPIIKAFPKGRKQDIWDQVIREMKTKLPRPGQTQGQMSTQEAMQAVEYMKPYFDNIDTTSSQEITEA